jgi:hypothetical protein
MHENVIKTLISKYGEGVLLDISLLGLVKDELENKEPRLLKRIRCAIDEGVPRIMHELITETEQKRTFRINAIATALKDDYGEIITFGCYKWRVLEAQGGAVLVLSERIIKKRAYHNQFANVTWETCDLRKYLHEEFYNKLGEANKARVCRSWIKSRPNPWYGTDGGNDTDDYVFLLSIEEAAEYFGDSGDLKNRKGWYLERGEDVLNDGRGYYINDAFNSARIAKESSGQALWWWLRSSGDTGTHAAIISAEGNLYVGGGGVNLASGGVRPALWLNV